MTKKPKLNLAARTFQVELGVFLRTCESVGTVRALSCYLLAEAGEWDQYLDLSTPDPELTTFADDYLVTEALRKNPHLTTSHDPRATAVKTWWSSEMQCKATNERIRSYLQGDVSPLDRTTNELIGRAQNIIADILGPLTPELLEFAEQNFRFGPGATSVVTGNEVLPSKKYECEMHLTPRLFPFYKSITPAPEREPVLRSYSKVTFVPKTSKTHRAIAIEPHLNIYVQLGIGALLKRRMKRYGLNIDKQADINRQLASIAQFKGLATVDLSAASDTIASELVWLLLPFDWASLLDVARTEFSVIDDTEVKLSKFSSMGNGYTFELESLIFLALARASGDPSSVVFGDDIIIKRESYPLLDRALVFLGFTVNSKKTFLAGRFFESCGSDYWNGVMVRPFYFKGNYHDFESACIRIANKVRYYSHLRNGFYGCDVRFVRVWGYARRACPAADKTGLPIGFGNDGLIKNFDEACPPVARHGHEGYVGRVIRQRTRVYDSGELTGALRHKLHRGPEKISDERGFQPGSKLRVSPLGSYKVLEASRVFSHTTHGIQVVPSWPDIGPWISSDQAEASKPL